MAQHNANQDSGLTEPAVAQPQPTKDEVIKHMVNRFLQWKLPENFNPDGGISFQKNFNEQSSWGPMKHEPVGTNLFDATQAEEMVRYMMDGLSLQTRPAEVEAQGAREPQLVREHLDIILDFRDSAIQYTRQHPPKWDGKFYKVNDVRGMLADFAGHMAKAYAASEREARKKAELVIAARNIELRQARELPTALMEVIRKHDHCKADRSCLQAIEVFVQAFLSPAAQEK